MPFKPSKHPKDYDRRNKHVGKLAKHAKDIEKAATDVAVSLDSVIKSMDDWLKANREKPKEARTAGKAIKSFAKVDVDLFTSYAKIVADIMALEGQIEDLGDPGNDKGKKKEFKKLTSKHGQLNKSADGSIAVQKANLTAMSAMSDVVDGAKAVKAPKF